MYKGIVLSPLNVVHTYMTSRITQLSRHLFTMAAKTKTDITLYTVGTPNGIKASILLEELGLDYKV